ncbi:MAG TPA: carbon-nitrogen hydrolase family protein [Patescibacteria group bacterium]
MLKVASAQCSIIQNNILKAIAHINKGIAWAEQYTVDVLCFPECYLQGYFLDRDQAKQVALDCAGEKFREVLSQIKGTPVTLIVGLIEIEGGLLFNTAVVIENGQLIGKYRKAHPNEKIYTAGNDLPVFWKKGVKYGINICNDANYPDTAKKLKDQGAEIIFFPLNNRLPNNTADLWRGKSKENLINCAKNNNCWVVSADVVYKGKDEKSFGCSLIVDPAGEIQVMAKEFKVQLIK